MRFFVYIALVFVLACESPQESLNSAGETDSSSNEAVFVDVTAESGINFTHHTGAFGKKYFPEMAGGGGGFFDFNGDGWEDLLLINGMKWSSNPGAAPTMALYQNMQNGRFEDVTVEAGLDLPLYGMGFAAADFDNDGDQDLFVTAVGPDYLFENDQGKFTDITAASGIDNPVWSTSPMFFDFDNDGWLDLFIANYVEWSEESDRFCSLDGENKAYCTPEIYTGEASRLYRNTGKGTFDDVSLSSGIANHIGKSLGVALLDFDEDGWLDFAVANDTAPDFLFHNQGDGVFREIGLQAGLSLDEGGRARAGMGIDVGIVDETGEETIFIGNFSNEMIGVYRDLGKGSYLDRAAASRIGRSSLLYLTFGLFLFDYDLDFDLDLFVANGHVQPEVEDVQQAVTFKQRPLLYRNEGGGTFAEVGEKTGTVFTIPVVGRGAGYADYDQDGDLDVLLAVGGGNPILMRNETANESRSSVRVMLEGTSSNKNGIGAQVVAIRDGQSMSQRVKTGSSYLSQSELTLTFGMAGSNKLDSLVVYWPSGNTTVLTDIEAGKRLTIEEGV